MGTNGGGRRLRSADGLRPRRGDAGRRRPVPGAVLRALHHARLAGRHQPWQRDHIGYFAIRVGARRLADAARWSFTLSATDANRWAVRIARQLTGRPKVLVFSYCYHGSVDEAFIIAGPDGPASRAGNVGVPVDPRQTTRVMTPFHNMALMSPATTVADADVHTGIFAAAADELLG